ncbi:MAG: Rrf2 family transcriptional regulator [Ruminococcus sp.]|nr:Rrf2 family transcriptional regulator [Ruminococcus sp.]MBQ1433555.1 Rrf2 family transcriptional regulator [Ruminococcus sp.]
MKVSTRVEYGLIALTDIAINSENGNAVSSADISERQNISQKYLEQIIIGLRQGGFVRGQKGSRGGYVLSRPADKIYLCDILNALDNSILADVAENGGEDAGGIRSSVNSCLWDKLNGYMRRFTERMTLADLISEYRDNSDKKENYMYYI